MAKPFARSARSLSKEETSLGGEVVSKGEFGGWLRWGGKIGTKTTKRKSNKMRREFKLKFFVPFLPIAS